MTCGQHARDRDGPAAGGMDLWSADGVSPVCDRFEVGVGVGVGATVGSGVGLATGVGVGAGVGAGVGVGVGPAVGQASEPAMGSGLGWGQVSERRCSSTLSNSCR